MSGLYIHIPFCKQKCNYCNFHFSTSSMHRQEMVDALCKELKLKENFLANKNLNSIYFGGGTPTTLTLSQLEQLFRQIKEVFDFTDEIEITLEANPDDLTQSFLKDLKLYTPLNRLSIGIQSFYDDDLKLMNRSHNAAQSWEVLHRAKNIGFDQFNLDLIFGLPDQTIKKWENNLEKFLQLDVEHLSCYSLTIEEKTAFHNWIQKEKISLPSEERQADIFLRTIDVLTDNGYEQYEISNYCRNKKYAKHNTAYWQGKPYLGIGPSAHSYNGESRYFNIAHNVKYMKRIYAGEQYWETEELTSRDKYNEYIMTGLRTKWGVSENYLKTFQSDILGHFSKEKSKWLESGRMKKENDAFILTNHGKLIADTIMSDLFY